MKASTIFSVSISLALALSTTAAAVAAPLQDTSLLDKAFRELNADTCGQICDGRSPCKGKCSKCINFTCRRKISYTPFRTASSPASISAEGNIRANSPHPDR